MLLPEHYMYQHIFFLLLDLNTKWLTVDSAHAIAMYVFTFENNQSKAFYG